MKKSYASPEFKVTKFEFESTLASITTDSFGNLPPEESVPVDGGDIGDIEW